MAMFVLKRVSNFCMFNHPLLYRIFLFCSFTTDLILLVFMLIGVLRWKGAGKCGNIWWLLYTQVTIPHVFAVATAYTVADTDH